MSTMGATLSENGDINSEQLCKGTTGISERLKPQTLNPEP
jgi:hypothetical protein